ncbi:MAG TPA: peptidoglycan-associated lipoprotein Pal [Thermoanaerobaculia bacterium]|nr:peptidoglycan-associated lipoprotein Pal [Thermoanaerobaculia bacterium]
MRNRTGTALLAFLAAAVCGLMAVGCPKKPPTTTSSATTTTEQPSRPPTTNVAPPAEAPSGSVSTEPLSGDVAAINRAGYLKDAYFDYDKADLRDDARSALSANAEWLKKYRSVQFLIEGHCDERGTAEYNLALGDRRANAAKEYLVSLGVDASRVKTVSYGKERPFCNQNSEDCWQQNRRGHFLVTAK